MSEIGVLLFKRLNEQFKRTDQLMDSRLNFDPHTELHMRPTLFKLDSITALGCGLAAKPRHTYARLYSAC